MVKDVTSNDIFHDFFTIFLFPRPLKISVDLIFFIGLNTEISRCIAAQNKDLGDDVNSQRSKDEESFFIV